MLNVVDRAREFGWLVVTGITSPLGRSARYGYVDFALPYLRDYLREAVID